MALESAVALGALDHGAVALTSDLHIASHLADVMLSACATGFYVLDRSSGPEPDLRWHSPEERGVIEPQTELVAGVLAKRKLRAVARGYEIRFDSAFDAAVVAASRDRRTLWLTNRVQAAYRELHRRGFAHSIEAWRGDELGGGVVGFTLGRAFFAETMFHTLEGGGNAAFYALVNELRSAGCVLLDVQKATPHLARFGAFSVPRATYLEKLREALTPPPPHFDTHG